MVKLPLFLHRRTANRAILCSLTARKRCAKIPDWMARR